MRIVKISDLSDDEKEKWQEGVRQRQVERENFINNENKEAEKAFNHTIAKRDTGYRENTVLPPIKAIGDTVKDIGSLGKIVVTGAKSGIKQVGNYIENATLNNNSNLKYKQQQMYMANPNVSEEEKALNRVLPYSNQLAKNQNILQMKNRLNDLSNNREAKYDLMLPIREKPETNLVRKAIQDSISKDTQKIQEEQSKLSNPVTKKLGEIAPSIGQMLPRHCTRCD